MVKDMGKTITREHETGTPFDDSGIDYKEVESLDEDQIKEAAESDPDAQPLTDDQIKHLKIRRPNLDNKHLKNG